ncbi:hypothetical protein D1872_265780 [compost metagenome]
MQTWLYLIRFEERLQAIQPARLHIPCQTRHIGISGITCQIIESDLSSRTFTGFTLSPEFLTFLKKLLNKIIPSTYILLALRAKC